MLQEYIKRFLWIWRTPEVKEELIGGIRTWRMCPKIMGDHRVAVDVEDRQREELGAGEHRERKQIYKSHQ